MVLTCTASGNPDPVISWYHIDSLLLETGVSVVLEEVEREDEGVYECVAVNLAGSDRDNVTLTVHSELSVLCTNLSLSLSHNMIFSLFYQHTYFPLSLSSLFLTHTLFPILYSPTPLLPLSLQLIQ